MTHSDAQREMAVEKYLLDELHGPARDEFEDHLFDCTLCAADLTAGADLADALRTSPSNIVPISSRTVDKPAAVAPFPAITPRPDRARSWAATLLTPWVTGPALAACLALLCIQSFVVQPRLHRELAEAEAPAVAPGLSIKGGATRSLGNNEITARPGAAFVLSVDIPGEARFREYLCTLVSPEGKTVWHTYLSPAQVNDTVFMHIPVNSTAAGVNVFKVEGIPQQPEGASAVSLFQRSFTLNINP